MPWLAELCALLVVSSSAILIEPPPVDGAAPQVAASVALLGAAAWLAAKLRRAWMVFPVLPLIGLSGGLGPMVFGAVALSLPCLAIYIHFAPRQPVWVEARFWAICAGWGLSQLVVLDLLAGFGRDVPRPATAYGWAFAAVALVAALTSARAQRRAAPLRHASTARLVLSFTVGLVVPAMLTFVAMFVVLVLIASGGGMNSGWQCHWEDGQCSYGPAR